MTDQPKIGLALGSGSARGMSHIGVIRALQNMGIKPDVVAGCSVGAMVGASYVCDRLDALEDWALSMTESKTRQFLSLNINSSGFIKSTQLKKLFEHAIGIESTTIENMDKSFGAVATDLSTGQEIWLRTGSIHDALWSSMAFPGLFPAMEMMNMWLVDGGLVNPVPVSLCRAMGADKVIAVNLNADIINSYQVNAESASKKENQINDSTLWDKTKSGIRKALNLISADGTQVKHPKTLDVISNSINIMSSHLTHSRLAGEPPDVLLQPRLTDVGLLQIHKADSCIEEGMACVNRLESEIAFRILDS